MKKKENIRVYFRKKKRYFKKPQIWLTWIPPHHHPPLTTQVNIDILLYSQWPINYFVNSSGLYDFIFTFSVLKKPF